jgi:hypothetical protein
MLSMGIYTIPEICTAGETEESCVPLRPAAKSGLLSGLMV